MKLRDIDFGPIWTASGTEGFFGEGYWYHKYMRPFGLNFKGCTFVAKTTTFSKRKGNMPRRKNNITPKEIKPKCIKIDFQKGIVLNAVGLSGPGAMALFMDGRWQKRKEPFFLSFMSVAETPVERFFELKEYINLLKVYLSAFKTSIGLQINYSCPNVGLKTDELVDEVKFGLKEASILGIPLVPKFNVLLPIKTAKAICEDENCDAICISNTIPWGKLSDKINWEELFGSKTSPLAHLGGGGLSGKPLLPIVRDWVYEARKAGIEKSINAGGGILTPRDVDILYHVGASSVSIGSIAILRGWRVKKVIKRAYEIYRQERR